MLKALVILQFCLQREWCRSVFAHALHLLMEEDSLAKNRIKRWWQMFTATFDEAFRHLLGVIMESLQSVQHFEDSIPCEHLHGCAGMRMIEIGDGTKPTFWLQQSSCH